MTGERCLRFASAWLDDAAVRRVLEPLIADWQKESRSLNGVARWRALIAVHWAFAVSFALMLPRQQRSLVSHRVLVKSWIATAAFGGAGIVLQLWLFFEGLGRDAAYLLPAALGTALPLALLPAVIIALAVGSPVHARTMMLRLVLMTAITLVPLLTWFLPVSNQIWRQERAPASAAVLRGAREITGPELLSSTPPSGVFRSVASDWNRTRREVVLERTSILLMPITMCALGLAVGRFARRAVLLHATVWWLIAGWVWLTLLDPSPWAAHVCLGTMAAGVHLVRRRFQVEASADAR
jgi:hypothetical protein